LIGIYGDDRYTLALRASFLIACYSFWVLFRPVKTFAQLKADREKWNMREYMREFKLGQRQAAWAKRSKLYRFLTSGGALLICLSLLALWYLLSLFI